MHPSVEGLPSCGPTHPYAKVKHTPLLYRATKRPGPGKVVLRENHITLDDRRSILEVITQQQNISLLPFSYLIALMSAAKPAALSTVRLSWAWRLLLSSS